MREQTKNSGVLYINIYRTCCNNSLMFAQVVVVLNRCPYFINHKSFKGINMTVMEIMYQFIMGGGGSSTRAWKLYIL